MDFSTFFDGYFNQFRTLGGFPLILCGTQGGFAVRYQVSSQPDLPSVISSPAVDGAHPNGCINYVPLGYPSAFV